MSENTSIQWITKAYKDLTIDELYAILRLRSEVFVVEQNCVFLDMDNNDQIAYHTMGWLNNDLVASTRLYDKDQSYHGYQSIGRVVSAPKYRKSGFGKKLMEYSIQECARLFGPGPIKIGAQKYLLKFYSSFGFVSQEDDYLEDGIPHVHMIKS